MLPVGSTQSSISQNPQNTRSLSDLPDNVMTNILSFLPKQAEWNACCLTSKNLKTINEKLNPLGELVAAIRNTQADKIKDLLGKGVSVHLRIAGTKFCPNVSYTPLLCAQEYGLPSDTLVLIKEHDREFTEQFLKNKLLSLQYDIDPKYAVKDCSFNGAGLDHFSHHHHLLPDMIDSLKSFFDTFEESAHWDKSKTQRLLEALKKCPCLTCSKEESSKDVIQKIKKNELVIFSKSVNDHKHWVTYAGLGSCLAIGNRGFGSGEKSGATVYKIVDEFSPQDIDSLFDAKEHPKPIHALEFGLLDLEAQRTGSCSRSSLEAGTLAGIFLLLNENNTSGSCEKSIVEKAKDIFKKWRQYDQVTKVEKIIQNGNPDGYDLLALATLFTNVDICPKTAEKLWRFLIDTIKQKELTYRENFLLLLCEKCFEKGNTEKAAEAAQLLSHSTNVDEIVSLITCKFEDPFIRDIQKNLLLYSASKSLIKNGDLAGASKVIDLMTGDGNQLFFEMRKLISEEYAKLGQMDRALAEVDKLPIHALESRQNILKMIVLEYANRGNDEKAIEIIRKIEKISPLNFENILYSISIGLRTNKKNDLSLKVAMMIPKCSSCLNLLNTYLNYDFDHSTETLVIDAIFKRIKEGWGDEQRDVSPGANIAETFTLRGHLAQALSIINITCTGSTGDNPDKPPEKEHLEKAIALIRLIQYTPKNDIHLMLISASFVARGNFEVAAKLSEKLSDPARDWVLNKSSSELLNVIAKKMPCPDF